MKIIYFKYISICRKGNLLWSCEHNCNNLLQMARKGRRTDLCGTFFVNRTCLANTITCSTILTSDIIKRDWKNEKKETYQKNVTLLLWKTVATSWGLTEVAICFNSLIVFMGWPCQSERGKGFQTDSGPNYPPPTDKVHINKNININNIGGQFFCRICWKVEFSSQKSEILK